MVDAVSTGGSFQIEAAPMIRDRSAGWAYVRSFGDVFEANGSRYLTSAEAVQFAQQHPEIFSSARAFDSLGSPLPLVPIASLPGARHHVQRVIAAGGGRTAHGNRAVR